jgi:RNA polymerase sigma-70 factor (ECF subfamily)
MNEVSVHGKMPLRGKGSASQDTSYKSSSAFGILYKHSHLLVFRYIYGLLGGPRQEVEDLTAETYTRAWKARHRFQGTEKAAISWLLKIGRNLVIDHQRRRKNHPEPENIDVILIPVPGTTPESETIRKEQVQILWNMLQKLSPSHREMLILRYMLGWRVNEIAEYLDLQENTVSVNIRRILERIRKNWPPD